MSQNLVDSIEEMASWDEEMCCQNIGNSLPKILTKFEESTYIEDGIKVLQIICKSFVPVLPFEEMEDKIFSRICKMICSLLTDVFNKVHLNVSGALKDTVEELKETISECLQWIAIIVECVERCVKQMLGFGENLDLSCINSLPVCAVNVLKQTYTHCKESSQLYGELLDDVGESLSILFKKAHSLQTALLSLLDKITVSGCYEEHVQILCTVCSGLFDVCKVVSSLDIKLVVSLWKSISRICSQNLLLMKDRFDVCPLISYLCEEVTSGYSYLFQLCPSSDPESLSQGDDKAFNKWVKIVGFQMKVLVALLRDFSDYLGSCEKDVLALLLTLHRSLPPCLSAAEISKGQEGDIRSQIVSATLPILNHLISSRAFRIQLTHLPDDMKPEDYLPMLLLQLMVLDLLPKCEGDVIDYWLKPADHNKEKPTKSLVSVIFDSVRLCFLEMRVPVMLPGIMVAGKPLRPVSLYEHVIIHLCGFVGSSLSRHFSMLELTLLENVLQEDDLSCLLATDAWSFMARYGTASLCYHHVQSLIEAYFKLRKKGISRRVKSMHNLIELIKRLIKFLSPQHQMSLTEQYPLEGNVDLWLTLTLTTFCEQVQRLAGTFFTSHAMKALDSSSVKLSELIQAVSCIRQVMADQSLSDSCLTPSQRASTVASVCQLWTSVLPSPSDLSPAKERLALDLLIVTGHLLSDMKISEIFQVVKILHAYVREGKCSVQFLLTTCHLLQDVVQCIHSHSDTPNVSAADLTEITHLLLVHPDALVQSTCLSSVAALASNVDHQAYLMQCVRNDNSLKMRLNDYLNKVPFGVGDFSVQEYLKCQRIRRFNDNDKLSKAAHSNEQMPAQSHAREATEGTDDMRPSSSHLNTHDKDLGDEDDPPAKRVKMSPPHAEDNENVKQANFDSPAANSWQAILDCLKKTARDLEQKCSETSPPEWFISEANVNLACINDCLTVKESWFDSLI